MNGRMNETVFWFLDLDDTILDFHESERCSLIKTMAGYGRPVTPEEVRLYSRINIEHWQRMERGEIDRFEVLRGRFEVFLKAIGRPDLPAQTVCDVYEDGLAREGHRMPGALEVLQTLTAQPGNRLFAISNGTPSVQHSRLRLTGTEDFFEDVFISMDMGAEKPTKAFFDAVFARIPDVDPARSVIVGDSLTSDIRGGANMGVRTVWFAAHRTPEEARAALAASPIHPDRTVFSLEELPAAGREVLGLAQE
ncbi:MAG: YjjG family noncanonical pyrimidine nucleotidase [Lachnospiraceae bacterium]|nr:YjjG family noncanonical pyrimidine nucleotidase [Lachnospiraceae bacterium]